MGGHNRAKFKDDFCAVAAQPSCGCSINADYVAVCRPNWPDHAFVRKIKGNPDLTVIGHMTDRNSGYALIDKQGGQHELTAQGWDAFLKKG